MWRALASTFLFFDRGFVFSLHHVKTVFLFFFQMDAATAKLVDAAMAEAFRDATVITVAHKLPALLESCDRVAVMSEGRVVEEGRPRCVCAGYRRRRR